MRIRATDTTPRDLSDTLDRAERGVRLRNALSMAELTESDLTRPLLDAVALFDRFLLARLAEALRSLIDPRYCLHEQRRRIEELGPAEYARLGYHELRIIAMAKALAEKNVIGEDEFARRMDALRKKKGEA